MFGFKVLAALVGSGGAIASAGVALVSRQPAKLQLCAPTQAPVREIHGTSYYVDDRRSVRDAILFEANRRSVRQIDSFHKSLGQLSDAAVSGDGIGASCATDSLLQWVDGGALLGSADSRQARSQRRWSAAAMSLVSIKLWPFLTANQRVKVSAYLHRLSHMVRAEAEADAVRNNHLYWAAITYAAAGRLGGHQALTDEAVRICRLATLELTEAGSLPLEDKRGARAREYNGFALFPLAVMAVLENQANCSPDALTPLVRYLQANGSTIDSKFKRWAFILDVPVETDGNAQFYAYGGGDLKLTAQSLRDLRKAITP